MAGNYIVLNSQFKPFTYQEMLAPLAAYTEEYNAQEAGYSELQNNTSLLDKYVDSTGRRGG